MKILYFMVYYIFFWPLLKYDTWRIERINNKFATGTATCDDSFKWLTIMIRQLVLFVWAMKCGIISTTKDTEVIEDKGGK